MRRRALIACALAATAVSAVAVSASSGAPEAKRATEKVTIADDYFAPGDAKIKKNSKVKWVWSDENLNTHNVVLTNDRPKGVKKGDFRSSSGAVGSGSPVDGNPPVVGSAGAVVLTVVGPPPLVSTGAPLPALSPAEDDPPSESMP